MSSAAKGWLIIASPLVVFVAMAWGMGALLGLSGADAWVLRGGLAGLGVIGSGTLFWFVRKQRGGAQGSAEPAPERDVDAAFAAARSQLAASRVGGKTSPGSLPALVVIGPASGAKTTSIVRSDLEPELLAGGVMHGEVIAPTSLVNLWYACDTLIVEAGGAILTDDRRWSRLARQLSPSRLAGLFSANAQPPRSVVVCIGCDRLVESAEASLSTARQLRERLGELARAFGTSLPVHVLFTKLDRLPSFADYVRGFTAEEAREVLGVTMAGELTAPVGSYADRQTARVQDALDHVFRALAAKRTVLLGREYGLEHRGSAYEFPREFRKLSVPAAQFLLELCRPSQLQVSPFLRGIYFSGVQAVIVSDAAPSPQRAPVRPVAARAFGATALFDPTAAPAAAPSYSPGAPVTRKVPRWVFLDHVFTEAVLGDAAALDVTRRGAGIDKARRLALAAVITIGAFLALGTFVSFIGNARLESRVVAAARSVAALPPAQLDLPSEDALRRLDLLGSRLDTLERWDSAGAPLRLGFGLYGGSDLLAGARRVYFAGFDRLMFAEARDAVERALRAMPADPRPTDDYGASYDLLRAYLVTTEHPDHADPATLTPVLLRHWLTGRELDQERLALATRQFDRLGAALPRGHPFPRSADRPGVARARGFLLQFAAAEPIYRSMLAEAGRAAAPFQFNRAVDGSAALVVNAYEVPAAFTREGWTAMQSALQQIDRFYLGEPWVLGEPPGLPADREKLVADLRALYVDDYIGHWRAYLAAGSVPRYADLRDASRKLAVASSNRSPVLAMLAFAARHTAVDSQVTRRFHSVHVVTPPTLDESWAAEGNAPYVQALAGLLQAVEQTANAPRGGEDQMALQAVQSASAARGATRELARAFDGGDPAIGSSVQRFLEEPIARVDHLLGTVGIGELNTKGRAFCADARALFGRLPLAARSPTPASVADVAAFFRPVTGRLARFHDEAMHRAVERQGNRFVPKQIGAASVSPAFADFFGRAMIFSEAIFRDGATEPRLRFQVAPQTTDAAPIIRMSIDGQEVVSGANIGSRWMVWTARTASDARISAELNGTMTTLLSFQGTWAVFQLFHEATVWEPVDADYRVEWVFPGRGAGGAPLSVAALVTLGTAPVLQRNYFGFNCPGEIVR